MNLKNLQLYVATNPSLVGIRRNPGAVRLALPRFWAAGKAAPGTAKRRLKVRGVEEDALPLVVELLGRALGGRTHGLMGLCRKIHGQYTTNNKQELNFEA